MMADLSTGPDGRARCAWCVAHPEYVAYHDDEWGRPVTADDRLYEKMCLEGFQAGLSWLTILRKRDAFRSAFANFVVEKVAAFDERDVDRMLGDAGIVRHRGKIEAAIGNATVVRQIQADEGSLAAFIWAFAPAALPAPVRMADIPATTAASTALSKELRRRGARFVGPTTMYALMQAMGMVNDHLAGCHVREAVEAARAGRPSSVARKSAR